MQYFAASLVLFFEFPWFCDGESSRLSYNIIIAIIVVLHSYRVYSLHTNENLIELNYTFADWIT